MKKRISAPILVALSLALTTAPLVPVMADEASIDSLQAEADTLYSRIEATTASYQQAAAEVASIEEQIVQNEARMAEIQAALPEQRSRTAACIKAFYKYEQSQGSLLSILLAADDFEDFIRTLHYLSAIHEHNLNEIAKLNQMNDELVQTQTLLSSQRESASARAQEALTALNEARAARVELQQRAIQVAVQEEEVREEAIAIARETVEAAIEQDEPATFTTASGNVVEIEIPEEPSVSTEPLVTNTTSQETEDWASRINAYLEGSPLEGYGQAFADAAAAYGVDPRLSPAIATIESGKGEYTFADHNAWGWGDSGWDSWEEAIDEQVAGLASGYDGTLTYEGAERYCPPNADEWYSSVASEMDAI